VPDTSRSFRSPLLIFSIWLLTLFFTYWVYLPGLDGPALFDDSVNLQTLASLEDNPSLASDVVLGNDSGPTGRPVSMLTFALEKLYFDNGVRGQKRTNLLIHLVSGSVLALLLYLLLSYYSSHGAAGLALALSALWLLSPLFVSTVLYPVQRMAQLSTFFMFASMLVYAVWRLRWLRGHAGWYVVIFLPALVVSAILSKENGLMVVPVIVLMEILWFQFRGRDRQTNKFFKWISLTLVSIGVLCLVLFQILNPDWVSNGYLTRPFTLTGRLLTEGRILWDYISQLLMPEVARMGVYQDDIVVSSSMAVPESTRDAWLAWAGVGLLTLICCFFRAGRYFAFAVLLFLVGHLMESTILSLELYFEHRNYFPSAGIFLMIGLLVSGLLKLLPEVKNVLLTMIVCYALFLSTQTSSQAQVWSSDDLIRIAAANAHPRSPRANINMAVLLARYGALNEALEFSDRAASIVVERAGDLDIRNILLSCYANHPLPDAVFNGLPLWSARGRVISATNAFHFLVRKLQNGECPALDTVLIADKFAGLLLGDPARATVTAEVYAALAVLENTLQRYQNAYDYSDYFLDLSPDNARGLLMKLHFATALGEREDAELVRSRLNMLEEAGLLTLGEQHTLSLYSEN